MDRVLEILGIVGLVLIVTASYIFEPIRLKLSHKYPILGTLISCSQCLGFWVGLGASFFILDEPWGGYLVFAGLVSLMSYLTDLLIGLLKEAQDVLWLFKTKGK